MDNGPLPLQGLSAQDTRWLLREVEAILREHDRTWTLIDGPAFELDGGQVLGLDNLARRLRLFDRARWPELVRDQLTTLLALSEPPESIAPEDLRLKLERPDTMLDLEYEPFELLPGLPAVLSAQLPGMTVQMSRLNLVEDRDEAYTAALGNLTRLPLPRHARRRLDHRLPQSWVEFLESEDSFGASRVMVLPDVVRRVLRRDFPASGLLVAVPTKFDLWLHQPVDDSVVDTAVLLGHEAFSRWSSAPFPLMPDVYLVSPDMQAEAVVLPDRTGAYVNQGVLDRLIADLGPDGRADVA